MMPKTDMEVCLMDLWIKGGFKLWQNMALLNQQNYMVA